MTHACLEVAQTKLAACSHSPSFLEEQFIQQHAYHSQPLDHQLKNKGLQAIEHILTICDQIDSAKSLLSGLWAKFTKLSNNESIATQNEYYNISSDIKTKASLFK
jgi:hypothetical protein